MVIHTVRVIIKQRNCTLKIAVKVVHLKLVLSGCIVSVNMNAIIVETEISVLEITDEQVMQKLVCQSFISDSVN